MQVTQIFFNWIEAEGKTWGAIIDHGSGGRRFYSLRGNDQPHREAFPRRAALASARRSAAKTSGGLAVSAVGRAQGGDV
jgi:hypothetical protein